MHVRPTRISLSERIEEVASVIPKSSHPRLWKKGGLNPLHPPQPPSPSPEVAFCQMVRFICRRSRIHCVAAAEHPSNHPPTTTIAYYCTARRVRRLATNSRTFRSRCTAHGRGRRAISENEKVLLLPPSPPPLSISVLPMQRRFFARGDICQLSSHLLFSCGGGTSYHPVASPLPSACPNPRK